MSTITLREIVEHVDADANPIGALMACFRVVRTAAQGEPATFDGACASLNEFVAQFGTPTGAKVRRFLDASGELADFEFPCELVMEAISVED